MTTIDARIAHMARQRPPHVTAAPPGLIGAQARTLSPLVAFALAARLPTIDAGEHPADDPATVTEYDAAVRCCDHKAAVRAVKALRRARVTWEIANGDLKEGWAM